MLGDLLELGENKWVIVVSVGVSSSQHPMRFIPSFVGYQEPWAFRDEEYECKIDQGHCPL